MEILRERDDIDPNKPDEDGHTPLFLAEGVVKLLFSMDDVDPDRPNEYGETP